MNEPLVEVRCSHEILRERIANLADGVRQLHGAIESLGKAGCSYPAVYRAVEQAERMLKYAERAHEQLPVPCNEGCRG